MALALLASAPPRTVTGSVTWGARDPLPPGSAVEVQLQELGPADAPARVVATVTLPGSGVRPPVAFRIAYDARDVDPRLEYTVRARVLDAGRRLLYLSDRRVPVLTRGAGTEVTIEVEPVRSGRSR
jgi:putative lipoprotein